MAKLAKGWGAFIETVEITDVQILSRSVKRNLEVVARESNRKEATLNKIEVDHEISKQQNETSNEQKKRNQMTSEKRQINDSCQMITKKQQECTKMKNDNKADFANFKMQKAK